MGEPSREEISHVRGRRRAKVYADENIEDFTVELLRALKVNIKSANQLRGHQGKDDEWHAAYALRKRRFLLTKNAKDFIDDRKLPWEKTFGVIAITGDYGNTDNYTDVLRHVVGMVVPIGEDFIGTKITVTPLEIAVKGRTRDGKVETMRFRFEGDRVFEWVEESSPS